MSLQNSFHTQLAIGILLNDEKELEDKLDLLTSISITTRNKETVKICEDFREELASSSGKKGPVGCVFKREIPLNHNNQERSDENNGDAP